MRLGGMRTGLMVADVRLCSSSEAGSYVRLTDFVYHSTLGLRVMNKQKEESSAVYLSQMLVRVKSAGAGEAGGPPNIAQ